MVPAAEGPRAADPRPSPRGDPAGAGGGDVGARVERARGPPAAVHGRRARPLSHGARADVPGRGQGASQGHEEGPLQDQATAPAGGLGASVSGTTGDLAFLRIVVLFGDSGKIVRSRGLHGSGPPSNGTAGERPPLPSWGCFPPPLPSTPKGLDLTC